MVSINISDRNSCSLNISGASDLCFLVVEMKYITEPEDIVWSKTDTECEIADNLPFKLIAYFEWDGLAVYSTTDLVKIHNVTKREANCIIFGIIQAYRELNSVLFEEWIIGYNDLSKSVNC